MVRLWIAIQSLTETTRVRLAIRLRKILIALKDEGYFSTKKVVKKKDIKKSKGLVACFVVSRDQPLLLVLLTLYNSLTLLLSKSHL